MDIPDPPKHIREAFRRMLLEGDEWGMLAANRAHHEFLDLGRYARAMEELVDQAEQAEIEALAPEADALEEDDQGEFWAWHYPAHWDQVVRGTFRASTIIALVSFVETTLSQASRDVRLITQEELKPGDLNGSAIEKSKKYLQRFSGFSIDELVWRNIDDIVQIRNALVHANSYIDQCKNAERIRKTVINSPGLDEINGVISIEKTYLDHCLECVRVVLSSLSDETTKLCSRRKQFEEKNSL